MACNLEIHANKTITQVWSQRETFLDVKKMHLQSSLPYKAIEGYASPKHDTKPKGGKKEEDLMSKNFYHRRQAEGIPQDKCPRKANMHQA